VVAVPDPWRFLHEHLPDVQLLRVRIPEPGRYYDDARIVVLRRGLLLEEERRYLWHEIVHARRRDQSCQGWASASMERSVEREAAHRAMPLELLEHAIGVSVDWHDFSSRMKVPEAWVRFRLQIAHPAETAMLDRACRWEATA
jgi:hypothetical protein